jgi:hypothetical protein
VEMIKYAIQYSSGTTYYINFGLTQKYDNVGLFSIVGSGTTGTTLVNKITGYTDSRLIELEKYTISDDISQKYVLTGSSTSDGVVYNDSTGSTISYWIGGINYVDYSATTVFTYYSSGLTALNSYSTNIVVEDKNVNLTDDSRVDSDIDVDRQSISVFENHYRIATATNLNDLINYAGGSYFNIIENN